MKTGAFVGYEDKHLAAIYEKMPILAVKGKGASIWDYEGKEYIDCMGAYGVAIVGHCHPKIVEAIKHQAERLIACHASIYNDIRAEFLEKLTSLAPTLPRVFLSNSGAEAVECAIKLARKHTRRKEIVAMMGGYHGKTFGALSVTWNPRYREPFEPLLQGIRFIPYGNLDRAKEAITSETAAVIAEPIQGESGVIIPPPEFLKGIKEICKEKGALLILDEVQTGFGRTGRLWAWEHFEAEPDIMCLAKGIAGGIPMGATLAREEVMASLAKGDHSSTFGGNPLACASASAVIDVVLEEGLPRRAKELGDFFRDGLKKLQLQYSVVRDVRGMGLMLAMDLRFPVRDVLFGALEKGALLLYSGRTTLRFLPPLVIEKHQIERVLGILEGVLQREQEKMEKRKV
ncbi:MAG: aspartate aminotransferase family protein [Candidatus Bathyarchaeia archaeon]